MHVRTGLDYNAEDIKAEFLNIAPFTCEVTDVHVEPVEDDVCELTSTDKSSKQ